MSKYAIIKLQGSQYKVSEGDEILIDRLPDEKVVPQILLAVSDKGVSVGTPEVKGAKVGFKILQSEEKGEKVSVLKYKSKSRYRKRRGFRPLYTRLLVEKITV